MRPASISPGVRARVLWCVAFAVVNAGFEITGHLAEGPYAEHAAGLAVILSGVAGSPDDVDLAGVAYIAFFLSAALGFGVLAVSHSRRHALGWRYALLGLLGAPVVLGLVLVAVPTVLTAVGLLPAA